jgi:hypothetical protein
MNPLMKLYLYENWCEDLVEKNEFAKNYGTFIGAFSNIEMARAITGEGRTNIESSNEDFNLEDLENIRNQSVGKIDKKKDEKQRHRRQVVTQG